MVAYIQLEVELISWCCKLHQHTHGHQSRLNPGSRDQESEWQYASATTVGLNKINCDIFVYILLSGDSKTTLSQICWDRDFRVVKGIAERPIKRFS